MGEHPWTDFGPLGPWATRAWDKDEWRAAHPNRHQVFDLPGVGLYTVVPDALHIKHLGTDQRFYASVMSLLVHDMLPGTIDQNVEQLFNELRDAYQVNGFAHSRTLISEANVHQRCVWRMLFRVLQLLDTHFSSSSVCLLCCCGFVGDGVKPISNG